jgi:steroid delta-isomerase-like uncharacterized protein
MTNKDVVRRLIVEIYNGGNIDLADELLDPEYVGHNPIPGQPPKVEGFKWAMRHLRNAFPDFHVAIESLTAEDDRVVAQLTARGTQQGPFQGLPPLNHKAEWQGIRIFRLSNGRIVEHWGVWDTLSMMQQLTNDKHLTTNN